MKPLTRAQLDPMGCATPHCGHDHSKLFLIAACHPKANVAAIYIKATGTVRIICGKCQQPVADIAVAATA